MRKHNKSKSVSVDGVVQRQHRRKLGNFEDVQALNEEDEQIDKTVRINEEMKNPLMRDDNKVEIITNDDVIENTRSEVDKSKIGSRKWRAKRKSRKLARNEKWSRRPKLIRIARRTLILGFKVGLVAAVYFAVITYASINKVIDRSGDGALALQSNIQPSELKGEGDGRVNIMLLGIGGEKHKAGNLADTIMVVSIDPFAKEMAMLSIPRDMYVDIPGFYTTKINAAHALGEADDTYPGGGIALMEKTLEKTLGISIHYYARVDFQGFADAIDTVGGVTINLDEAVYDPNFDWEFGVNALNLPAGENTLDGQTALLLSRARGASGIGLGVSRGDFGRADRQRDILLSLKDKVLSAGTYANPLKINELIRNAGDHARTDIQIGDMLRIYDIVKDIPSDKIISFGLTNAPDNYLKSGNIAGASVQLPKTGNYNEIKLFVRGLFVDGFIKQEKPVLDVYNGSTVAGLASETADELKTFSYEIGIVDNAPTQNYQQTIIYDLSNDQKPFTKELLAKRFSTTMLPSSELPVTMATTTSDFVIILGTDNANQDTSF